jgi:hypothetical protein
MYSITVLLSSIKLGNATVKEGFTDKLTHNPLFDNLFVLAVMFNNMRVKWKIQADLTLSV